MGIIIDGDAIREIFAGSARIREVYYGADLVWSGRPTSRVDYQWQRAYEQPVRVMFMGSSTTEGYGTTRNESFVTQFVSAICKQAVGAAATAPVKQSSGSVSERTEPGFHFLNAGVGGTSTSNYYGPDRGALLSGWKPDIVFHMIGSNDYAQQVPLSDVQYNVRDILGDAIPRHPDAQHVFIHSYRREDRDDTGITWAEYGQAIADVCSEYDTVEFLDAHTWWEELKDPDVDYLQDDRVHAKWTGNYLLARAVAAALRFVEHEHELIFHIDASEWTGISDGQGVGSITQDEGTLVQNVLTSTGSMAPIYRTEGNHPSLDFASGQRRMETGAWDGVHSLPITVYIVTASMGNGSTDSNSQPFFTRSVAGDDGYLWAWRERDTNLIKGASNTAFNDGVGLDRNAAQTPAIIAISYLPSGHIRYYVNSTAAQSTVLDRPSEGNGPWMRSLKLGTNTGNTAWSEARIREMHWHHGMDPDTVKARIATLADKHDIQVTTRVSDWSETTSEVALYDTVPSWADTVEIVAIGAGGGGGGIISTGDGGRAGSWANARIQATAGATLTAQPGRGSSGGSSNSSNGTAGGDAVVRVGGQEVLRAEGGGPGTSTNGNNPGRGAGTHTAFGRTFVGGGAASNGEAGNAPGGGGGPGAPLNRGHVGGVGRVWWRFVAH